MIDRAALVPARPGTAAMASASWAASTNDAVRKTAVGPAVQHRPVVEAVRGEEVLPALLAHRRRIASRKVLLPPSASSTKPC